MSHATVPSMSPVDCFHGKIIVAASFLISAFGFAVASLEDLSEIQLFAVVFFLGGFFGFAGKLIRHDDEERISDSIIVGMAMAFLGILFASLWEDRIGRNASVAVAFAIAAGGRTGAATILRRATKVILGNRNDSKD